MPLLAAHHDDHILDRFVFNKALAAPRRIEIVFDPLIASVAAFTLPVVFFHLVGLFFLFFSELLFPLLHKIQESSLHNLFDLEDVQVLGVHNVVLACLVLTLRLLEVVGPLAIVTDPHRQFWLSGHRE